MPDKETAALRDKLAALKAKGKGKPEPVVPTPALDPEVAKHTAELMKMFRRKDGEAPAVAAQTRPATVSLSEMDFATLKTLKETQAKLSDTEKQVESSEKSLEHVTRYLSQFVKMQQQTIGETIDGLVTPWQRDYAQAQLKVIHEVTEIALRLFVSWPEISDTALLGFGATPEIIADWRKWLSAYKSKEHEFWPEKLADLQERKSSPMLPGQEAFFVTALEQDGVDVKRRLEEISAERLRRFAAEVVTSPPPPVPLDWNDL